MRERRPFVGGNWKMNTNAESASSLARGVVDACESIHSAVELAVFPPAPYLLTVSSIFRSRSTSTKIGAQNVFHQPDGAYTGEISVAMVSDCGCSHVLAGHSERRHVIGESDELINAKVRAIIAGGLTCVLCVGETLDQREAGQTDEVNQRQIRTGLADVGQREMEHIIIAYEPVWAIGTGKTATPEQAQATHKSIRGLIAELYTQEVADRVRIIYGGSVKPSNAASLFSQPDIDGGLIGGASLKVEDFGLIAKAAASE
ncbi:MAG TPA: triose-phosphate isomerase [Phycisphaerales bacterium]|nr:triose-phosphate isomerase [Phycisphaerales bacterium]